MKPQMNQRRALWAALLLSALAAPVLTAPAAAGLFSKSKKTPTSGVREPVLNYEAKPVAEPELADLAIVSLSKAKGDFRSGPPMLAGDLALTASVPVLALPQDSKALDFDKPALIAWNGSPEAAHAVQQILALEPQLSA